MNFTKIRTFFTHNFGILFGKEQASPEMREDYENAIESRDKFIMTAIFPIVWRDNKIVQVKEPELNFLRQTAMNNAIQFKVKYGMTVVQAEERYDL